MQPKNTIVTAKSALHLRGVGQVEADAVPAAGARERRVWQEAGDHRLGHRYAGLAHVAQQRHDRRGYGDLKV